ncbi:MAG: hypothetical protein PHI85_04040 [Victivallaceae bacterium]|nr:hypothetical protein [Victivallaceae bacterium]
MTGSDFTFVPRPLVWRRVLRMVYERFSLIDSLLPPAAPEFAPLNAVALDHRQLYGFANSTVNAIPPSHVAALAAGIAGNRSLEVVKSGTLTRPARFEVLSTDFALAVASRYNDMYYLYFDAAAEKSWEDCKDVGRGYVVPADYAATVRAREGTAWGGSNLINQSYESGFLTVRLVDLFKPYLNGSPKFIGDASGEYRLVLVGEATGVTANGVTVYNDAAPPPAVAGVAPGGEVSYLGPIFAYEGAAVSLTLYSDMRQDPSRMLFCISYIFRNFFSEFSFFTSVNDLSAEW